MKPTEEEKASLVDGEPTHLRVFLLGFKFVKMFILKWKQQLCTSLTCFDRPPCSRLSATSTCITTKAGPVLVPDSHQERRSQQAPCPSGDELLMAINKLLPNLWYVFVLIEMYIDIDE